MPALAQSEIEVNTTILRELPPPSEQSRFKPITLKPPPGVAADISPGTVSRPPAATVPVPRAPSAAAPGFLTGADDDAVPAAQNAPVFSTAAKPAATLEALTPSGHPAVAAQTPLDASPRPASVGVRPRMVLQAEAPVPPRRVQMEQQAELPPVPSPKPEMPADAPSSIFDHIQEFPVMTKVRSTSNDPSMAETPAMPLPVETPKAGPSAAVPINADVVAAMAKQLSTPSGSAQSGAVPPVPVPKPVYDKKNRTFATAPDKKVRIEAVKVNKSASTRVMATRMNAPSMPPPDVAQTAGKPLPGSGPMPPPRVTNDHVMNKMMDMEKGRVMAGIEDAVKRSSNIPGRHVSDNDKLPVIHGGGTSTVVGAKRLMRQTSSGNAIIRPGKDEPAVEGVSDGAAPLKPEDKTAPDEKTASVQMPSPPPEADYKAPGYISINYDKAQLGLDEALQADIKGKVLPLLKKDPAAHLQIQAYASDAGDNHNSRQRSLARGLAVREYLIGQGISQDRLDIHAMGMQSDRDPLDRVDFVVASPAPGKKL